MRRALKPLLRSTEGEKSNNASQHAKRKGGGEVRSPESVEAAETQPSVPRCDGALVSPQRRSQRLPPMSLGFSTLLGSGWRRECVRVREVVGERVAIQRPSRYPARPRPAPIRRLGSRTSLRHDTNHPFEAPVDRSVHREEPRRE